MRPSTLLFVSFFAFLMISTPLAAQNATGSWNGTYTFTQYCDPGTLTSSGPARAEVLQQGNQITADVGLSDFGAPGEECQQITTYLIIVGFTGTVSGSSITGAVNLGGTVNGTISGDSMTLTIAGEGNQVLGTVTLTRTSSTAPAAGSGAATGSYNTSDKWDFCTNTITYGGSLNGNAVRVGGLVSADARATGVQAPSPNPSGDGSCLASDFIGGANLSLYAEVSGSTVTGSVSGIFSLYNFTGTLNGNTITGIGQGIDLFGLKSTINLSLNIQPATGGGGTSNVVVSALPAGMLQPAGAAGATDSFGVTNNGDAATDITLSQTGSFFTVGPSSFTLQPRQSQIVTIAGKAQPAGLFSGTVSVSGSGVPAGTEVVVRLLSAIPPTGIVNAAPAVGRVETVGTGETAPGSVEFTNSGSSTIQGLVTADVTWLEANNPIVSIPPGGKAAIPFVIDRKDRPDAGALFGTASCVLSLTFLNPAGSAAKPAPLGGTSTRTVSVPVSDTVKPTTANGTPAQLQSGELALFAAGMKSGDKVISDLVLVNRRSSTVNDLKLFAAASSGSFSQLLNLPSLTGDAPASLASVTKNVFDINNAPASLQVRSAQTANVAISPVMVSTPGGRTSYATSLPVLRSDAGADGGTKLYLAGVDKTASLQTALDLQEVSGRASTVQSEFLRADGSVISSRSDSLAAFGFVEIADAAPTGTASVRVTNQSGGSRVAAFARISDATTGDSWTVIDPKAAFAAASGDLVVPVFGAGAGTTERFINVLNPGSAAANVRVSTFGGSERRRAVRAKSIGGGGSNGFVIAREAEKTVTVGAQQTSKLSIDPIASGYVRLSATSPLVANGRLVVSSANGAFGTSLPAIPVSAAIAINGNRRFAGVDDAGANTISAAAPGTYRPSLMLIETAGQSAKVRVTLKYTLPGGTKTTGSATAQREFTVNASQNLLISDLGSSIIGSGRSNFGDLRNMQLDIDVIEGGGRVIPAVAMTDNSTGDLMVRVQ